MRERILARAPGLFVTPLLALIVIHGERRRLTRAISAGARRAFLQRRCHPVGPASG